MVEVSVLQAKEEILTSYLGSVARGKEPRSYILLGQPGIGKTQAIQQIAGQIEQHTGEACDVHVVLSACISPEDIVGFPEKTEGGYAEYLPFKWVHSITEDRGDERPAILFFDDLLLAHEQVQGAFFRVALERYCGFKRIRDNVLILAASNRVDDNAGAQQFNTALKNRFRVLNIRVDSDSWLEWAAGSAIHPLIQAYIQTHRAHLNTFDPESPDQTATPRSWENLSDWLAERNAAVDFVQPHHLPYISGIVGEGVAHSFIAWSRTAKGAVPPSVIVKDPEKAPIPGLEEIDILYVTVYNLVTYMEEHPDRETIESILTYICREEMPREFGFILLIGFSRIIMEKLSTEERVSMISSSPSLKRVLEVYKKFSPVSLDV